MADIKEFEDFFVEASDINLQSHVMDLPVSEGWTKVGSPTLNVRSSDNTAFAPDAGVNIWATYRGETTNFSKAYQYIEVDAKVTDRDRTNARGGVGGRYDTVSGKCIIGVLDGSTTSAHSVNVYLRTGADTFTDIGGDLFDFSNDTFYRVRLELKDLTGSDIEAKVYIDGVLKTTQIVTDSDLYGLAGKPCLAGRLALGWSSGDEWVFDNFEAGTITVAHEFTGNAQITGGGSATLVGALHEFAGNAQITAGGSVSMSVADFSFKWSIDNLEARTDYGFPTVYVDIDKDIMPTGAFPCGEFYDRRLTELPRLAETQLDTRFGITGFQRVTFTVDNSDRLITGFDLQGAFVRMFFVDDAGNVYKEFKGQVVDWTLSHTVTINVEDVDALALTQDLPKRTLNDLVEAEKIADGGFAANVVANDLGKPIPIIFARAVKVPLLYVKADETSREYDYIIGEGVGLNSKFFQEVFTVYRNEKALDSIEGTGAGATSTTLTLESADRRPDSWFKYWWVEMLTGNAAGEITDVTAYDSATNKCTVSTWGTTPTSGTYRLREWRFYDGSQASPYDDYAFLRFKKRMGEQGRTDPIYADVNGLEDEVNVVDALESVLSNSTWGLGISVNASSFATASALSDIAAMKCEGGVFSTTGAGDLLRELLGFRDLYKFRYILKLE